MEKPEEKALAGGVAGAGGWGGNEWGGEGGTGP